MSERDRVADCARIDEALSTLGEYFDTVQIFATRHESGMLNGTIHTSKGVGNWFARYGQIRSWLDVESSINSNQAQESSDDETI